ncbi:MAG: glucosamine-6-phosphate deaminase [Spirochaetes bacterium]|nr:glucosamine-6-phosphate deaminase [Spirochaetota bacterium]
MSIKVYIAKDFDLMSKTAADIVKDRIKSVLMNKDEIVLGLATGNSPTGLYKYLAESANRNEFECKKIRSFNLDEYVGLPGENVQQRVVHPESYCYFMIENLFSMLDNKFIETNVPFGSLIDQEKLAKALKDHPDDYELKGTDKGKSIEIKANAKSEYLSWIREEILNCYEKKIEKFGGIDIQIIGVGGRGHVAFHESGIPFKNSNVLLVKLDNNTIENAVKDGHFSNAADSPNYAISMGAQLVYKAKMVVLLANGARKTESITKSLLEDPTPDVPISYGQTYSKNGGELIYVLDEIAGRELINNKPKLSQKGIELNILL